MTEGIYEIDRQPGAPTGFMDRKFRDAVRGKLRAISRGHIRLIDGPEELIFGAENEEPGATIRVEDASFYSRIALRGAIGAAEAYMDGLFSAESLTDAVRVITLNRKALDHLDGRSVSFLKPLLRFAHWLRRNDLEGSRRNIADHYDLGNDFFALFLDPTLTYSSAVFEGPGMTLEEGSIAKYDRLCRKLDLRASDHLLEIGTGWGGMALYAAGRYGCRVTTTTISQEQYELARERIAEAGLSDRIEVLFEDYRALRGSFDKLVSIEMIEAVGQDHWDDYFRVCSERLTPEGIMAIQAISVRDQDMASSLRSVDFIKKYIFPGGQLVSISAVCDSMTRATDLRVAHFEDISEHYAETLRRWRARMEENIDAVRGLGLPDRFIAMWNYYLCYCEASFMERATHAFQMVFEKPDVRRRPVLGAL